MEQREQFVTHRREDGSYQLLKEHLEGVARLAEQFAGAIGAPKEAWRTGLLHDVGKYSRNAQRRQRDPERAPRADHSTAGAKEALSLGDIPAAFAIAGHHGGLPDSGSDEGTLVFRLQKKLEGDDDPSAWRTEITIPAQTDLPAWADPRNAPDPRNQSELAMFTRMLFSCLVDADFLDTERALKGEQMRGGGESLDALLGKLQAEVAPWLEKPRDELCGRRNQVLLECLKGGEQPQGLYTLTVPTGGGKTMASLAFALSHARARGLERVIYVIPYTSIIEQTAEKFAKVLGEENVLAHYAQADLGDDPSDADSPAAERRRLACENWDAPVVVTTAVQFFESMFAAKTSRCRKLHNIARSVLIFDEAQTLPVNLLRPCVWAISQLVRRCGATAVLCTATQPALSGLFAQFAPELPIRELAPDPDGLFDFFRRVRFEREGALSDEQLASRLAEEHQALCIVNSRKRAREVFSLLPKEGRYHLSTLMTAGHRARALDEIRARLSAKERCVVVSTSLVEAGVDVDFPTVWREMAGLDSILQAAGRCNREGLRPAQDSVAHIFTGEGRVSAGLRLRIAPAEWVLDRYREINTRAAVADYFDKLLQMTGDKALDQPNLADQNAPGVMELEGQLYFRQVAEAFHLIDDKGARTVYIPTADNADDLRALRMGEFSRALLRRLGKSAVSLPAYEYQLLVDSGAVEDHASDGFGVLLNPDGYSPECGLDVRCEGGSGLFA